MKYKNISNDNIRVTSKEGLTIVNPGESFEAKEEINNSNLEIINEKISTKNSNKFSSKKKEIKEEE